MRLLITKASKRIRRFVFFLRRGTSLMKQSFCCHRRGECGDHSIDLRDLTSSDLKLQFHKFNQMVAFPVKPLFVFVLTFSLLLVVILLSPSPHILQIPVLSGSSVGSDIWGVKRIMEWRPCKWWLEGHLTPLPAKSNGYIRVDCYGGLNQMRRDLCDGVGIARLLNATLVLPKFEVAAYWNESSGFEDVFDVDYFIQKMSGYIEVVKELPKDIASKEPFKVDCSKRKGQFDYIESVLPSLLEHHYISFTPAMSQRRDRYPEYARATLCQACYSAIRLTSSLEKKAVELLDAIPKPFLSLHLRFEPDMVAYSQCEYPNLTPSSIAAIEAARVDRKPWSGELAQIWRKRGKCPLTPNETVLMLQSLNIPTSTNIYLAAGDGLMEMEGFTSVYTNVFTKSVLLNQEDFTRMHGNTKAALDYHVSINSDAYVATYFGNMDKIVAAMRTYKRMHNTLFLSRKAFAELTSQGLEGMELKKALWEVHKSDFAIGRGFALPDCFCEFKL